MTAGPLTQPIAIVGMGCRFSGDVTNPEKLWELIAAGRTGWSKTPSSRFDLDGLYHPNNERTGSTHVRGGHFLAQDIAAFDASFFNMSNDVASSLDPCYRMELEVVYEALESAGIPIESVAGSDTSVFAGTFFRDYHDTLSRDLDVIPRYAGTGTAATMSANRISHFYDLHGPSMSIDTGCSTTLTALHAAVQNLRNDESRMSIVTGASLMTNLDVFISMSNLGFLSPDGRSFAFDGRGNGYGRGEGVAAIIIKPLEYALQDGDPIRAVIRETALNHGGKTSTITSPSQTAQEELIRSCYRNAGLNLSDTTFVEAHGTGTPTGDPLEVGAIAATVGEHISPHRPLYLGSVKPNIGHTEAVSGLASIIKASLAVEKGLIPPNSLFESPNKKLRLDERNIRVPVSVELWPADDTIRRVSVNNFGFGGANAHTILERYNSASWQTPSVRSRTTNGARSNGAHINGNASNGTYTNGLTTNGSLVNSPHMKHSGVEGPRTLGNGINGFQHKTNGAHGHVDDEATRPRVFVLSAKDEQACRRMASDLKDYVQQSAPVDEETFLDRLTHTLGSRRSKFGWNAVFTADTIKCLSASLQDDRVAPSRSNERPKLGFVFTGQGAQWFAMGRELLASYPVFRSAILEYDGYIKEMGSSWTLMEELHRDDKTTRVNNVAFSLPMSTAIQLALVDLLKSWDIVPHAVTSHSSGEVASAYVAGAITARAAIGITYLRGFLTANAGQKSRIQGGMMAVGLSREAANNYIAAIKSGKIVVACVNSPSSVTVSGDLDGIIELEATLLADKIFARRLKVSEAFHSDHMLPAADSFGSGLMVLLKPEARFGSVRYSSPKLGGIVQDGGVLATPAHWVESMLMPVEFMDAFRSMCYKDLEKYGSPAKQEVDIVIEVGPHGALAGPIQQIMALPEFAGSSISYLTCLTRGKDAVRTMQQLVVDLILKGYRPDLDAVNFPNGKDRDVRVLSNLPQYPWNHQTRYWLETRLNKAFKQRRHGIHDLLGSPLMSVNPAIPTWRHILRVSDVPWVRDHMIQSNIIYPGAGMIAMAIEATKQISQDNKRDVVNYELRDVDFAKALLIPDTDEGIEVQVALQPCSSKSIGLIDWMEFRVCSATTENTWIEHCKGLIKANTKKPRKNLWLSSGEWAIGKAKPKSQVYTRNIDPADVWAFMRSVGIYHGPIFRNIDSIRSNKEGSLTNLNIADIAALMPQQHQSEHVIHPTTLDSVIQAAYSVLPMGAETAGCAFVPRSIKKLLVASDIACVPGHNFKVFSRLDHLDAQGFRTEIAGYNKSDEFSSHAVLEISGLTCQSVGVAYQPLRPAEDGICHSWQWIADASLLKQSSIPQSMKFSLPAPDVPACSDQAESPHRARSRKQLSDLVLMFTQKVAAAKILEIGAGAGHQTLAILRSLEQGRTGSTIGIEHYDVTDISMEAIEAAKERCAPWSENLSFRKLDISRDLIAQGYEIDTYDLIVADQAISTTDDISAALVNIRKLLRRGGRLLFSQETQNHMNAPVACDRSSLPGGSCTATFWNELLNHNGFTGVDLELRDCEASEQYRIRTMVSARADPLTTKKIELSLVHGTPAPPQDWLSNLQTSIATNTGIVPNVEHLDDVDPSNKVIVYLGDLSVSQLAILDASRFSAMKSLTTRCKGLLWISQGATIDCEIPDQSLHLGFIRTLRNEYADKMFATLDIDPTRSTWSKPATQAIGEVLIAILAGIQDTTVMDLEYAERAGTILVPRLSKNKEVNKAISHELTNSLDPHIERVFQPRRPLHMTVRKPGLMDTLCFSDDILAASDLPADYIEIEPRAFGLNFRDVMVAMGQLECNAMGYECSGIIRRLGTVAAEQGFKIGDPVCALLPGHWSTQPRTHWTSVIPVPTGLSFEEAASIPLVFATAFVSLHDIARLRRGESVLIHAATGGVGQAAIILSKLIGAEIYVTVGTEAKREFVMRHFGIPADHIFSSRDTSFAKDVLSMTSGKGVNVVLNSLAGALLQESFDCLSEFGRFIEIGKRDLEQNSQLSMNAFTRNVSFTSLDLLTWELRRQEELSRVMRSIAKMFQEKTISTIGPLTTFPISEVEKAFRMMQAGQHMGKIIITCDPKDQVPVLQAVPLPKLRSDVSYLLVGGLGGVGRALCEWMLLRGAKHLIILSRSARKEPFVDELEEEGCEVRAVACDVADSELLAQALQSCSDMPPVGGVIQGAMLLRDSTMENMTGADFIAAIRPKMQGSWNLHEHLPNLDFFVMLSSIIGVMGGPGQANYAAGGSYQDALASYRRAHGLPAVSIDLGMVKNVGIVASSKGIADRLLRLGLQSVGEEELLRILDAVLIAPCSPQIITGINTDAGSHWENVSWMQDPRFGALRDCGQTHNSSASATNADSLRGQLIALVSDGAAAEAATLALEALSEKLAAMFSLNVTDIESAQPLSAYGVDSLVAVELRNWITAQTGADISIFELLQSSSITDVSLAIVEACESGEK